MQRPLIKGYYRYTVFGFGGGYAAGADEKNICTAVGARNTVNYITAFTRSLGRDLTPAEQFYVVELMAMPVNA